jgi:drug/metabolite transporter (DMT)-like permease
MKGTTIALMSCMFLALDYVFNKVLLGHMSPVVLVGLTSSVAAVVLFIVLEVEDKLWDILKLRRGEFIALLAVGLLSGVIGQLLYAQGLKESQATNAVLITRVNSLLIALLGVAFLGERMLWNHWAGAVLMLAGVATIATEGFRAGLNANTGNLLFLLAAAFWGVSNIVMKKYLSRLHPEVIVVYYYGFSGFVLMIVSVLGILGSGQAPVPITAEIIGYFAGLVILVNIVGRYLWYYSFEHTSACNVGLASLSIPLFGVIYAVSFLGEIPRWHQLAGGFMIFAGLVVIEAHAFGRRDVCHPDVIHRLKRHNPHH